MSTYHRHPAIAAIWVGLFWFLAAIAVAAARFEIGPATASALVTMAVLIVTAYVYMRLVANESGISHALGVGITWLMLSIATEIALTAYAGHGWFTLLGSPDRPLLRNLLLFVWIFSPALFVRCAGDDALRNH
jgi:hypothetical protein